ncbi:MAG: hypothetical protein ABW166_06650 [Sedimenticola sp.]
MTTYINDIEREHAVKTIQGFMKQPAHAGGILVLGGPRGVGKTRLVDEAITPSTDDGSRWNGMISSIVASLDGRNSCRNRMTTTRKPRQLERYLIKVELHCGDIFYGKGKKNKKVKSDSIPPQDNILDALIFELTSFLDPRLSRRLYGKTLRQQLGFWRFWFSPHGLILPGASRWLKRVLLVFIIPIFAMFFLFASDYIISGDGTATPLGTEALVPLWVIFPYAFISTLFAAVLLRFLDWSGFRRFSERLYAVAHADSVKQKGDGRSGSLAQQIEPILKGLAGKAWLGKGTGIAFVLIGLIASISGLFFEGKPLPGEAIGELYSIVIPILGIFIVLIGMWYTRRFSLDVMETTYSNGSSAWKITLLRRYLYLFHQLGIEPVIVLDELDKIESNPETSGPYTHDEFRKLFDAFIPMKQNLGASFIWIWVAGPALIANILENEHKFPPSAISTLIQKTISIGPVTFDIAKKYIISNGLPHESVAYHWIAARGNYAKLYSRTLGIKLDDEHKQNIGEIARICTALHESEQMTDALEDLHDNKPYDDMMRKWGIQWMMLGVLDAASRFLMDGESAIIAGTFPDSNKYEKTSRYDYQLLMDIGARLFLADYTAANHNVRRRL